MLHYNITKKEIDGNGSLQELFLTLTNYQFVSKKSVHKGLEKSLQLNGWKKEYQTSTPVTVRLDLFKEGTKIGVEIEFFSGKIEKKLMHFEYLFKKNEINVGVIISFYHRNKKDPAEPHYNFFVNHTIPIYNDLGFKVPLILCLLKRPRR